MVDIGALFRKGPADVVSIDDQLAFMTQVADTVNVQLKTM